ncbi:tryptophan-rich sensory protein [Peribacillus muralis]|uniref:tryptophan-rich sensory protein n=1 Tax=Peribacillus muralis TaxID=264697 RepID=UPI00070AE1EB|nr:tryptophan-rich sensory protein [Peribacillus muralis]MCK1994049.1 tryptophan-rich sensory protein [Peribacillus muralis]MCK2014604.1 tryptophan-rich sensory protein [Peribacillus muralis]
MLIAIVNLLFYLFVVTMNFLANYLPFNGQTSGEISDKLDVLFTPAGYVFSIWGFIYLLLAIWVFRQFTGKNRNSPATKASFPWFALSCVLNGAWLLAWHYEYFLLSVFIILALLATLLVIYTRIKRVEHTGFDLFPFSIYSGWVSVATIANISYYLTYIEWDGFGISKVAWTITMLIVATILAFAFAGKNRDWGYPLVFVWAFIGIGVRNNADYPVITTISYILAAIILIVSVIIFIKNRRNH